MVHLDDLVKETQQQLSIIKKEYKKYFKFNNENPWYVNEMIESMKASENYKEEVPTFDTIISFKKDYLIDDYTKIYKQIHSRNPHFLDSMKNVVLYYHIIDGLYEDQLKQNFKLGERDNQGRLVTGSNLVLNSINIGVSEFLNFYWQVSN